MDSENTVPPPPPRKSHVHLMLRDDFAYNLIWYIARMKASDLPSIDATVPHGESSPNQGELFTPSTLVSGRPDRANLSVLQSSSQGTRLLLMIPVRTDIRI